MQAETARQESRLQWLLLLAVFVIATCGLIYELVAGTLASYLLGDSVFQFSTIIGVYLFAMGIGSWLSRFFNGNLIAWFIKIEILVGLVGGFSSTLLFLCFPLVSSFAVVLYSIVLLTGILVGLEIPILMRILQGRLSFKDLVSRVFTFDYIGALLASIIFPLVLVPSLGLIRTALFFGILNIAVGIYLLFRFQQDIRRWQWLLSTGIICLLAEVLAFAMADQIMQYTENLAYNERIVYSKSSPYQRIVLTRHRGHVKLYLNGNLQFNAADEYRYHEALVHPAMLAAGQPRQVLVLGGGDGLAVREVLKYPSVQHITLVDLDPQMTRLFRELPMLQALNDSSLLHSKLSVVNADAFQWLRRNTQAFDCIIIDFPDPSNYSIGKLYSQVFYKLLQRSLAPDGVAVVQSTSPFVAPNSFWCVDTTLKSAGFQTLPYHNYVPSFGEWGYIMATAAGRPWPQQFQPPVATRYFTHQVFQQMRLFPPDMLASQPLQINRLNNQALVQYFEKEWSRYTD